MSALMLALFLGLYLLYKYITREAELVRLKADFVDNVSHTLKTPLTRMALLAENVQQGWVTEETQKQEFFHTITREITLMNQLIGSMLDFSRIEAGKKKYDFRLSSLPEIVRSVVERHWDIIEKNRFETRIEISDDVPPLELDREAIAAMTADLIRNALKYWDKEKYIGVRVYRENRRAVLEVEDRGIGIAEKELAHIFKKFHRAADADPAVKAREGSGLGLFLAHHTAAAHGGAIQVKSRPGKGSAFRVTLPLKNEKQP
jgi:signal transduction histidine kinase